MWMWVEGGVAYKETWELWGIKKKCLLSWLLRWFYAGDIPKLVKLYTGNMWSLLFVKYTLVKCKKLLRKIRQIDENYKSKEKIH